MIFVVDSSPDFLSASGFTDRVYCEETEVFFRDGLQSTFKVVIPFQAFQSYMPDFSPQS